MRGTLSEGVLPTLLRHLYVGRMTGSLHFTGGGERRTLRFQHGHIVRADTDVVAERLGETLVRLGHLSAGDLARATEIVVRDKRRLGVVLQEMGVLDRERMGEVLALQAREVLLRILAWEGADYEFVEAESCLAPGDEITLQQSTGDIILEAVRRVHDPEVIRRGLGDTSRVLAPSNDPLLRFQRLTLSPADGFVLSRVDGTTSAAEVIGMIPMPAEEAERSLYCLLCTGVLEFEAPRARRAKPAEARPAPRPAPGPPVPWSNGAPARPAPARPAPAPPAPAAPPRQPAQAPPAPPAPAPRADDGEARRREIQHFFEGLRARNHFEVLGLAPGVGDAAVKDAYFRLAKRFHPDVHHGPALADLRERLEAIFIRLGQAYDVLRTQHSRESYAADLAARAPRRPQPEPAPPAASPEPPPGPLASDPDEARKAVASVRQAERLVLQEKFFDAVQLLQQALPRLTGKPRQRARVMLAQVYLKNPHWAKQAEAELLAVLSDDPHCHEAHATLGSLYRGRGMRARALSHLRKAAELNPESEEVREGLAALEAAAPEPEPPEEGGLLKKILGR